MKNDTHTRIEEKWKPKEGSVYYYINTACGGMEVQGTTFTSEDLSTKDFEVGNCFLTKELAEEKLKKIKEILNKVKNILKK